MLEMDLLFLSHISTRDTGVHFRSFVLSSSLLHAHHETDASAECHSDTPLTSHDWCGDEWAEVVAMVVKTNFSMSRSCQDIRGMTYRVRSREGGADAT